MTTLVVGAGRGLGRGIAATLAADGIRTIAISRTAHPDLRTEVADATDPKTIHKLLDEYEPDAVILVAGAAPVLLPLPEQTWETFSVNWHTDVRIAFEWLRAALTRPLRPGSRVVVFSSGAALA